MKRSLIDINANKACDWNGITFSGSNAREAE